MNRPEFTPTSATLKLKLVRRVRDGQEAVPYGVIRVCHSVRRWRLRCCAGEGKASLLG